MTSDVIDDDSSSSVDIGCSNKAAGRKLAQLFSRYDRPLFVNFNPIDQQLIISFRKGKGKGDEDGYESDASTNSTRSTSSSFLRYQNRAAWKKLSKKTHKIVLQRRADGTSKPVGEEPNKRWPAVTLTFDKIYRRQNQISKKGKEDGGSSDVSVSSIESEEQVADESQLAPPAPSSLRCDTEEEVVVDDEEEHDIQALIAREDLEDLHNVHPSGDASEQLSGIPTSETPSKPSTPPHLKVWSPEEKTAAADHCPAKTFTAPKVIDPEASSKKVTKSKSGATTEKTITGTLVSIFDYACLQALLH